MATAFAVYCSSDKSLNFYKRDSVPATGSKFEGKIATSVYTGIEGSRYTSESSVPWWGRKTLITNVTFVDAIAPISTAYWFYGFTALTSINLITNLDTSKVTDMTSTFHACTSLTTLDISGFNTDKVTSMKNMFSGCKKLTTLDVSHFNTNNVTNMLGTFRGCPALTTLDLSNFNTSKVTDMSYMFQRSLNATNINLSSFDTSNVTKMAGMFSYNPLTNLDLSHFDTSKVTDMSSMFSSCKVVTTLDLSNFDTSNVTDMSSMFTSCTALTNLDLSSFNTSKVTEMGGMFSYTPFTSLDISNFDTSNVTEMRSMFYSCEALTNLDLSHFNTSNVTDMCWMFYGCKALTALDLSSFNTNKVTAMEHMFSNCSNLTTIYVYEPWSIANINYDDNYIVFENCPNLVGAIPYDSSKIDYTMANYETGYLTEKEFLIFAIYSETDNSLNFYNKREIPAINDIFNDKVVTNIYTEIKDNEYTQDSIPWFDNKTNIIKIEFVSRISPSSTSNWFNGFSNAIDFNLAKLNTKKTGNMSNMFSNCSKINLLDLTNLNTASVTSMDSMFSDCTELRSIYVDKDKWSTEKVTSSTNMFSNCNKLSGAISYDATKLDHTYANIETGYLKVAKDWLINAITMEKLANAVRKITKTDSELYPHEMIELLNNVGIKVAHDGEGRVAVDISIADISYDENGVVRIN